MKPRRLAPSLQHILANVAAGRAVASADYERLVALCRRADEEAGIDVETARTSDTASEAVHTCARCNVVSRHVYCPRCGNRM